jgi:hypothetical protein
MTPDVCEFLIVPSSFLHTQNHTHHSSNRPKMKLGSDRNTGAPPQQKPKEPRRTILIANKNAFPCSNIPAQYTDS